MRQKQKDKKGQNLRFDGQNKLLFWHPALQYLGTVATCKSF
jgi:hypothetical protein